MGDSISWGYDQAEDYRRLCQRFGEPPVLYAGLPDIGSEHFKALKRKSALEERRKNVARVKHYGIKRRKKTATKKIAAVKDVVTRKFYVASPKITGTSNDLWAKKTLNEAIKHAEELLDEADNDRDYMLVVQVVRIVRRQRTPIVVEKV